MREGKLVVENLNYAGIVTRLLQPILPLFFAVQFNFLYDGYRNEWSVGDLKYPLIIGSFGLLLLASFSFVVGSEVALGGLALESLLGVEAAEGISAFFAEQSEALSQIFNSVGPGTGL